MVEWERVQSIRKYYLDAPSQSKNFTGTFLLSGHIFIFLSAQEMSGSILFLLVDFLGNSTRLEIFKI